MSHKILSYILFKFDLCIYKLTHLKVLAKNEYYS